MREMRRRTLAYLLAILFLLPGLQQVHCLDQSEDNLHRKDFPPDFVFGAGTSAYQVEGAASEDGRSPSIWDTATHAGAIWYKDTGDVASDEYHKYKEDVKLMAETGLESYRFSISWSRLIPKGRGDVNSKGVAYYNNLIDELLKYGIEPHVTLYHLDLPQVIQDEYGGWLSPNILEDFTSYAAVCFREFGDRVKRWTTIIEPNIIAIASYDSGVQPPNRCSYPFGFNCTCGNSTTEPYLALHNMLMAHASVFLMYKKKYQAKQNGRVGLNVYAFWFYPISNSTSDMRAAQRAKDFYIGWIIDPLIFGDYPATMKRIVGPRLPSFTKGQSKRIKGSFDFIGLNYYTSLYVQDNYRGKSDVGLRDFNLDMFAAFSVSRDEAPTQVFAPVELPLDPAGLPNLLDYVKHAYGNPHTYIEENGYGLGMIDKLNDTDRVDYLRASVSGVLEAIRDGANVKGYFVWSFLDVFEFLDGYGSRFGLYHVDFDDGNHTRRPKLSAFWYRDFLKGEIGMKLNETSLSVV